MKYLSIIFASTVLLAGCSSVKVSSDYDNKIDFAQFKTYRFTEEAMALPVNDLVRKRITNSITNALQSKGLTPATGTPDLLVDLATQTREEEQTTATSASISGFYGRRWVFGTGLSSTQYHTTKYTVGTLIISLVDAGKKELVWEGRGSSTITEKTLREDKLEAAIATILAKYPPTKK